MYRMLPIVVLAACSAKQSPSTPDAAMTMDAAPTMEEAAMPAPEETVVAVAPIASALDHAGRTDEEKARDMYRHPEETLTFFEVSPNQTVVELWAGGGWYSHVLAPYLTDGGGHLYVTQYPEDAEPAYRGRHATAWKAYVEEQGYADSTTTITLGDEPPELGLDGEADVVLTFRNVHNWAKADIDTHMFQQAFTALKPGGVFGVVDHRAAPGTDPAVAMEAGYIDEQAVIDAVTAVGFEFVGSSEINANPLDTKDHPEGVWTLPPSYRLEDVDRDKYSAIGESDRMTLKFRKPM